MVRKGSRGKKRRCRYYVNTNFFIDLEKGVPEAEAFATRHRGEVCTSTVLLREFRNVRRGYVARNLARRYGIGIVKVRSPSRLAKRALQEAVSRGLSPSKLYDLMHIYVAKRLRAALVTADDWCCREAVKRGVACYNHREGKWYAPRGR